MDRSKRDRQGGQRRVDVEGRTDSESTSFDGSLRDKSEVGALERMGSAATMDFSPETGGGGESFQARFHRNVGVGERKVRAKIDSPRSGSVGICPGVDVEEQQVRPRSIRPSGGKDRHSKVQTAKGLRDRRVRLSVATAIQFYDVQDRLGYDQPSKAVEWLLKKAKAAIDELPPVPSPTSAAAAAAAAVAERPAILRASSGSAAGSPLAPPASYATAAGAFAARFYPHVSSSSSKERDQGEEEQLHEQSVLETSIVREGEVGKGDGQGSPMARLESRVKARERARERMKEKTTGNRDGRDGTTTSKSISSPPHQSSSHDQLQRTLQLQQSSSSSSLENTSVQLGGAGESMAYSSFTSLLQSPLHQPFQQVLPLQQQQQQFQQHHGSPAGHHLYHQSQFIGPPPQHSSFQQALLHAASLEPRQFIHSPFSQHPPPAPPAGSVHHSFSFPSAALTSPLDFASAYSAPPPGSLSLSQLGALGIFQTSGNQQFPSESAFVSSTPHFRASPLLPASPALAPSAMLDESPSSYSIPGLLRPQFSFPYANLPNVSLPLQFEPYQSSSGYAPHHFVSGFDRGASGPREFNLRVSAPAVYQTLYQSPGITQGVDDEIGELKNRSSSPTPRPP